MRHRPFTRRAAAALLAVIACTADSSTGPVPTPPGSITITTTTNTASVYQGDDLTFRAVVRDAAGEEIPGALVTWSSPDTTIVEINASGAVTTVRPGVARITARSGDRSATLDLTVRRLTVLAVSVLGLHDTLGWGDVSSFGIRATGEGGRLVPGRTYTLGTTDSSIAIIDPAGRVRAIAPGPTAVVVTVEGVSTAKPIVVAGEPATLPLREFEGARLPVLIAADTVEWNGVREYAEVYLESGSLQLSGGSTPRYRTLLQYAQYAATVGPNGQRQLALRAIFTDRDRGVVSYDHRGDLKMDSELVSPLLHTASVETNGFAVRYKIAGDDAVLSLFFRREPK